MKKLLSIRSFTLLAGALLIGLGLGSGFAVWIAPFFWEVKTEALSQWWVFFVPGIPLTFGLWMLYKSDKWADSSFQAAEQLAEEIKEKLDNP